MKTLPSKELLSKVFKREVSDVTLINDTTIGYYFSDEPRARSPFWEIPYHKINIFELAYRCKEWATIKGYVIIQDTRGYTKAYRFPNGERKFWEDENMDLTIDRIIQACEWIREQTK